jgi:pimeloyl-ACP methyl ester carboxylesterase
METRSRGFMIHYEVTGTGPPLVLVPGTMSSAAQWTLFGYIAELTDEFRAIAVDPLGHGRSDKPHAPDAYAAAEVTADLLAVLDAEGLERATVWGYSRGGWLACLLAAAHPERVERIAIGGFASHAHEAEVPLLSGWVEHLGRGDWDAFWRTFGVEDRAPLKPIEEENDPQAVAAAVAGSLQPTREVDLRAIQCPSVHYVGGEDWIVDHVRADAAMLDAPFHVLPGRTHLTAFADAAQALAVVRPGLAATG